jgi:hypothetical protein
METVSSSVLVKRDVGELLGLPTAVALAIFIGVPVLILGSTGILLFYCLKARAAKRRARVARPVSKTSHHTIETDQEMGVNSIRSVQYGSSTSGSNRLSFHNHLQSHVPNEYDRQLFATQVFGPRPPYPPPPSYRSEGASPNPERRGIPSPIAIPPQRPKTAPTSPLNGAFNGGPVNVNLRSYGNRGPLTPLAEVRNPNEPEAPPRAFRRRSKSLDKPPPIQINSSRPTHSPSGSVRSLSVFPHRHVYPPSPGLSPTYQGSASPPHGASPSPPPVSPPSRRTPPSGLPPPPPPPPSTRPNIHVRHPSMDRNSLMPIAPILIPFDAVPSTPSFLEEEPGSGSRQGRPRGNSNAGNYL